MTHADSKAKTTVDFIWQAPFDFQGDVLFRCTFVKDYSTFWVAVASSNGPVRVGRSSSAGGPPPPPPAAYPTTTFSYVALGGGPTTAPPLFTNQKAIPPGQQQQTNTWAFPTAQAPSNQQQQTQLAPIYSGCGDTKGCFGLYDPSCIKSGTCSALVTYALKGLRYEFELWATNAQSNSYVAIAFSHDNKMVRSSSSLLFPFFFSPSPTAPFCFAPKS